MKVHMAEENAGSEMERGSGDPEKRVSLVKSSFSWIVNPMEHDLEEPQSEAEAWLNDLHEKAVSLGTTQGQARAGNTAASEEAVLSMEQGQNIWQKAFSSTYAIASAQAYALSLPAGIMRDGGYNRGAARRGAPVFIKLPLPEFSLGVGTFIESFVKRLGEPERVSIMVGASMLLAAMPGFNAHTNGSRGEEAIEALCSWDNLGKHNKKYGDIHPGSSQNKDSKALLDPANPDNEHVSGALRRVIAQLVRREGASCVGLFALMHPVQAVDHPDFLSRHPQGAFDGFTLLLPAKMIRTCLGQPDSITRLLSLIRNTIEQTAGMSPGSDKKAEKLEPGDLAAELKEMGLEQDHEHLYGGLLWRDAISEGLSMNDLAEAVAQRLLKLAKIAREDMKRQNKAVPLNAQETLSFLETHGVMQKAKLAATISISAFAELTHIASLDFKVSKKPKSLKIKTP